MRMNVIVLVLAAAFFSLLLFLLSATAPAVAQGPGPSIGDAWDAANAPRQETYGAGIDIAGEGKRSVAAGGYHSCAITGGGGLKCWGANDRGQLGDGTESAPHTTPVNVVGLGDGSNVTSVGAGNYHTCAVVDGGVKCWGYNDWYQLGIGSSTSPITIPVQVSGLGAGSGATQVVASYFHTCALVNGGVKCWGDNGFGQLGDGTYDWRDTPVDVSGLGSGSGVVEIAAGHGFTCALIGWGGKVKCWGYNIYGQLGLGETITADNPTPEYVKDAYGVPLADVDAIAAGTFHACALISGGVKCWGYNGYGQLGNGASGVAENPTPVDVTGLGSGSAVTAIGGGGQYTCALTGWTGGVQCWGYNYNGQLGDGTTTLRTTPVSVKDSYGVPVANLVQIALGGSITSDSESHTCAQAGSGEYECWGYNAYGQVGDGTTTSPRMSPVQVTGISGALPDLVLEDVYLSDNNKPYHPQYIHVGATVRNTGTCAANGATVEYYLDSVSPANLIGEATTNQQIDPSQLVRSLHVTYTLPITVWENHDVIARVWTDGGDKDTTNNMRTERFSVYYADLRMDRDAFKDKNPAWDFWMWKDFFEIKIVEKGLDMVFSPTTYLLLMNWLGVNYQEPGHCYGMSHASISYLKDPTTKPVYKDTYQMLQSEYLSDVRERHWEQLPLIAELQRDGYGHPKDEYARAESYLKNGWPVIVGESPEDKRGKHAVVGYKIIKEQAQDGSPTRAILYTYDSNKPMNYLNTTYDQPCVAFQDFDTATGSVLSGRNYWYGYELWEYQAWDYVDISIPDSLSVSGLASVETEVRAASDQQTLQTIANTVIQELTSGDQILIVLASDVAFGLITDSQGRRIGWTDEGMVNEIPGASYDISATGQVEAFFLPANLTYTVESYGGDSSCDVSTAVQETFDLSTFVPNDSGSLDVTGFEDVATSATSVARLSVAKGNTGVSLEIDTDGDGTTDQTQQPNVDGTASVVGTDGVYLPAVIK